MDKISVLGGGSWGTTLANLLAEKDLNVSVWARDPKICLLYTSDAADDP